ncbi:MAG: hypothetical protein ACO1SV_25650 [Fimbriimonas sp.]
MLLTTFAAMILAPTTLYTLDRDRLTPADAVVAQCLQGLTARKGARIWLETKGVQETILQDLRKEGARVEPVGDVWKLLGRFRAEVKGAIVYKLGTPSLSVANGLCGPMDAVAIDETLLEKAKGQGLKILVDARGMTERDAFRKYRSRYKKGFVIEQALEKPGHLRDFAVKHSAFVMDATDREFRKEVIRAFGPNPFVLGWGRDEYHFVEDISAAGGTAVPGDWCVNLSVLEALPVEGRLTPPAAKPARLEPGMRYVAFTFSDGDNVAWMTNDFATGTNFYASPLRGRFPVSWEVSPLLSRFAPRVLRHLYATATPNDDFVTGPGLPGYVFPDLLPDREVQARASAPYLKASGLRTMSVLNANSGSLEQIRPWMRLPEVTGAIYKDYSPYHRSQGRTIWEGDKPIVALRWVLWEGMIEPPQLVKEIAAMPTEGEGRFGIVNLHAWSYGKTGGPLAATQRVVDNLPPNVRVVTANQILDLMRQDRKR